MDEDLFAVFEDDSNTATDKTVNTKPTNKDAKLEYVLKYYWLLYKIEQILLEIIERDGNISILSL